MWPFRHPSVPDLINFAAVDGEEEISLFRVPHDDLDDAGHFLEVEFAHGLHHFLLRARLFALALRVAAALFDFFALALVGFFLGKSGKNFSRGRSFLDPTGFL